MAYCRFGEDSDLYLYGAGGGKWICAMCSLAHERQSVALNGMRDVALHLFEHHDAGHKVPDSTWDRVYRELREEIGA